MPKHDLKINARVAIKTPTKLLEQVLHLTLLLYGKQFVRRPTETSLVFISDPAMTNLNKLYRHKKGTTNVLSFSFVRPPNKIGAGEPLLLGEVLISPKVAAKDARLHKHTLNTEIALLFLHGLLHVLRFDHETGEHEQQVMQTAENAIISRIPALDRTAHGKGLIAHGSGELVYPI